MKCAYAYLSKIQAFKLAFVFRFGNDDLDFRQRLPWFHEAERMWTPFFPTKKPYHCTMLASLLILLMAHSWMLPET
jgi:hypothetical protein